jgi:hypothetical protein
MWRRLFSISLALLCISLADAIAGQVETSKLYREKIEPVLTAKCGKCHGLEKNKAELDLSTPRALLRGGESGSVVVPGKPDESLLIEYIDDKTMPPDGEPPLTDDERRWLRQWVTAGSDLHIDRYNIDQHAVTPLMWRRCTACHGGEYQEGDLDLRTRSKMLLGGKSGPAMIIGNAEKSLMIRRVQKNLCPPVADLGQAGIEPMRRDELNVVIEWINSGATVIEPSRADASIEVGTNPASDVDAVEVFWSFRPIRAPDIPDSSYGQHVSNPIDRFLAKNLVTAGLKFSPPAPKATLLRRLSYDLLGLPPSAADVRRFLQDERPDAYQRLVDRLLASPRYGERWGRHWLDLAGYADSEGKRSADTIRPWAWRYRDYVIRAWNEDKPYSDFLFEQIAGDEMVDYDPSLPADQATIEKLVATGFLRMAPDGTSANPVNRFSDRVEVIADEIDILGRGVLGLTLACARCHSHKYDPISQREYYQIAAIFRGAYDEYDWMVPQPFNNQWKKAKQRLLEVSSAEEREQVAVHNKRIDKQIAAVRAAFKKGQRDDKSDQHQKAVNNGKGKKDGKGEAALMKKVAKLQAERRQLSKIRALWDRGRPSPTYVYRRGDETQPSQLVSSGIPTALSIPTAPYRVEALDHRQPKTGRRTALAKWLVHDDNPLVSRVIVNRVWHHHFGTGIVKSVDNFGKLGTPPTHSELLDWLAADLQSHDWSLKRLHRLIVTTTAYRQSSEVTREHLTRDPDNRLLSRMPLRRLSAEEVRDTILQVAGELSLRAFGPPDAVTVRKDGLVSSTVLVDGRRRSIYVRHRRKEMLTVLETFDLPQMNPNCVARMDSTVVSQPLYLWNSKMVYEAAASFARQTSLAAGSERSAQVDEIWLRLLSRFPSDEEKFVALAALAEFERQWRESETTEPSKPGKRPEELPVDSALTGFCHTLFNTAAALFVD